MVNGGSYLRLTRKAEGFDVGENSQAKRNVLARAGFHIRHQGAEVTVKPVPRVQGWSISESSNFGPDTKYWRTLLHRSHLRRKLIVYYHERDCGANG